jgi:dienelactone hydrolase
MDEHLLRTAVIALVFAFGVPISSARAEIKAQAIDYKQGDATLEGYLAYDDANSAKRPGIIVAHEWGGLTPYEKMRSEQLAKLGFVAFAADIYGKGV